MLPKDLSGAFVSHGTRTHPIHEWCDMCEQVKKEYEIYTQGVNQGRQEALEEAKRGEV